MHQALFHVTRNLQDISIKLSLFIDSNHFLLFVLISTLTVIIS
jgi:hypothetical protein